MKLTSKPWWICTSYLALITVAVAVIAWTATSFAALPSPNQLAPNIVARISHVPNRVGAITRAEFHRALLQAAAAEGRSRIPKPDASGYKRLKYRALETLLEAVWLKGQAAQMDIAVTPKQVSRDLARLRQNFDSAAEFHRFVKQARYTRRDLREQIELELLGRRIEHRVVKRAATRLDKQKALREFVAEFNGVWRARTVCAPAYAIDRCSNLYDH